MQYKNGREVFPASLLKELQKYIQGELIYIPKDMKRAGWGEKNGSRQLIKKRNEEIYQNYLKGESITNLEKKYSLSIDSIRKIIYKTREQCNESKI